LADIMLGKPLGMNLRTRCLALCLAAAVATAFVASALAGCASVPGSSGSGGSGSSSSPFVGKPAPAVALNTTSGKPLSMEALKGRPVLLSFFASW
jgi:cytochrome oxidase Cu insertion factor (SCO1/SenC/PrrC family)